jgi:hypothetical protein
MGLNVFSGIKAGTSEIVEGFLVEEPFFTEKTAIRQIKENSIGISGGTVKLYITGYTDKNASGGYEVDVVSSSLTLAYETTGDEYYTPPEIADLARNVMGDIDLDPFSCKFANDNFVNAEWFFSKEDDCHKQDWACDTLFMNPPYSRGNFDRAVDTFLSQRFIHGFEAIVLTNNNTDTAASQKLLGYATAICLPKGRLSFYQPNGKQKKGNDRAQIIMYFGAKRFNFIREFQHLGRVYSNSDAFSQ